MSKFQIYTYMFHPMMENQLEIPFEDFEQIDVEDSINRMQEINDERLQAVDLLFAFEDYYSNLQTVQARLGDRNKSDDQDVALGTFQGLLKKHKS